MRDREDFVSALPTIQLPTLIIVGESDALTVPAMSELMHQSIGGSELLIVKKAGHISSMEQPGEISKTIGSFLAKHPAES